MKLLKSILLLLLLLPSVASTEVVLGRDGIWYGNICMNQLGWELVQFQPVGSMCFMPRFRAYGVIINR
jgi:hypothetical protein